MYMFKKNKELLKMLEEYLELTGNSLKFFGEAMEHTLENKLDEHFEVLTEKTHREESNADDMRRKIELEMYKKSLLPELKKIASTLVIMKFTGGEPTINEDFKIS